MRLILTLVLATGLAAICQGQIRAAAAGLPQPARGAIKTKCAAAASPGAPSGSAAAPSTNPACGDRLDWRLSQHGPGFWTADPAASAPGDAAGGSSPSVLRATPAQASANAPPGCMNYQVMVVISGEPRQATIAACPQPDGNWQVTQYTPGLPAQTFTVPAPPATAGAPPQEEGFAAWGGAAPTWDWAAAPWFFGFAPAVVVVGPGFHHFHHFGHEFGHGFAHGFAHRFGFAHGFAVRHGFGFSHGFGMGQAFGVTRGIAEAHGVAAGRNFTFGMRHGFTGGAGFAARRR